ncbi:MAG: methylated-DNA--[Oscillospiraceae bacterium]|nr:methylated-DNA--[protein]-cysteine S-methyltransferase [Oscillospiraceae bacterium]
MAPELYCAYQSPLGGIVLRSDGAALTGLRFMQANENCSIQQNNADMPVFGLSIKWLDAYFGGRGQGSLPPLAPHGTAFQREVWAVLLTVPYGETVTYGALAAQIAAARGIPRMSAQAIGQAAAKNPILLMIPCHRLIGADGALTGYAGGVARKERLLLAERDAAKKETDYGDRSAEAILGGGGAESPHHRLEF